MIYEEYLEKYFQNGKIFVSYRSILYYFNFCKCFKEGKSLSMGKGGWGMP